MPASVPAGHCCVLPWWEGTDEAQSRCSFYSIGKIICRDFSEPARADSDRLGCRHEGRNNHDRDAVTPPGRRGFWQLEA
jgi:hypothetical protein